MAVSRTVASPNPQRQKLYSSVRRDNAAERVLLGGGATLLITFFDFQVGIQLIFQGVPGSESQNFGLVEYSTTSRDPGSDLEDGLALLLPGKGYLTHNSHGFQIERVTPFSLKRKNEKKIPRIVTKMLFHENQGKGLTFG